MNLIINDDCLSAMDKLIENGCIVDAIICDLPYGMTKQNWDNVIPFDKMWQRITKILKPKGVVCLFGSEPFASKLRLSNLDWYKYDYIWEKNNAGNFQLANYHPLKIHEIICVFYNDSPNMQFSNIIKFHLNRLNLKQDDISKLVPSKSGGKTGWVTNKLNGSQLPTKEQWAKICNLFQIEDDYDNILSNVKNPTYNLYLSDIELTLSNKNKGGTLGHMNSERKRDFYTQNKTDYPRSIIKFKKETGLHPTQKPVKLIDFLIKTYSNKNETILDFCMGSGTTIISAINNNRNYIGIEKDSEIFDIAFNRIRNHIPQYSLFDQNDDTTVR